MVKKIIEIYQSVKDYKAVSKVLELQWTQVRAIIYPWQKHGTVENLTRSAQPAKITLRAQRLIQKVILKHLVDPQDLKKKYSVDWQEKS